MAKSNNQLLCLYFVLVVLFMTCESGAVDQVDISTQTNITIEDSDVSTVFYAPSTSWRASTVPCSTCLNPPSNDATGGTWHDGTNIIFSSDSDDFGPGGGDTNGTSAAGSKSTSSSNAGASTTHQNTPSSSSANPSPTSPPANPPPSSSSSSAPAASPSDADGGDDNDGDHGDDGDSGKQKGKGGKDERRRDLVRKQDDSSNPFFTSGGDSDDPGFVAPQVTATINFTGSAIYLFAIVPVFAAPPLTNPTTMNLTFTLDGKPHGEFRNNPSSLNTSGSQYIPNFPVFSADGLGDGEHSIVVSVGPDSVFLFDYALVTQNATATDSAPNNQRTSSPDSSDSTRHHDISTFVGAIGGSVGFLSLLSLGLCISIRIRRRRFARRERNQAQGYAEAFTSDDHGGDGNGFDDGENIEGGGVSGAPPSRRSRRLRAAAANAGPLMAQVGASAPFVPRYFPGSVPASPPPYVAADADRMIILPDGDALQVTASGAVTPLPPPPQFNAALAAPPPMLDFYRTNTGGSYADRPPPTPPPEDEQPITMFGERGMVTPPPAVRTPLAEETDPMLRTRQEDEETASLRRSVRSMISSSALSTTDNTSSSNSGNSNRHTLVSVTTASPLSTPKSMPAGQLPVSSSSPSLISHLTTSSAVQPQAPAPEDTSKIPISNLLGGPVSILIGRNDSSSNPSPSRVQSLPHLRHSASHTSGPETGAEERMSLRSFSIDDHEGVGGSS